MSKAERFVATAGVPELADRCLGVLREWGRLQADVSRRATRKANRLADEQRVYLKALAATEEGKRRLAAFLDDDDPGVQAWAAARVLFWDEPKARTTLEQLQSTDTFPFNINAEMTLREFDAGRLRP